MGEGEHRSEGGTLYQGEGGSIILTLSIHVNSGRPVFSQLEPYRQADNNPLSNKLTTGGSDEILLSRRS